MNVAHISPLRHHMNNIPLECNEEQALGHIKVKGRKRDEVDLKARRKVHKYLMKLGIGEEIVNGSKNLVIGVKMFEIPVLFELKGEREFSHCG